MPARRILAEVGDRQMHVGTEDNVDRTKDQSARRVSRSKISNDGVDLSSRTALK